MGAGAPIAAAAGVTLSAEFSAEFKKTVKSWARFMAMDTEVVQPSRDYIDRVLAQDDVKTHIDDSKIPLLDRWTVFVVTGLMIARAGGTFGSSESNSQKFDGGPDM